MSNQNLEQVVRDSLEGYFRDLEGETPANVYDMVIRLVEKPLLEVVMGQADNNQSTPPNASRMPRQSRS